MGEQGAREGLDRGLVRLVGRRPRSCAAWPRASPSRGSRSRRSSEIGQTPSSVWKMKCCSTGVGAPPEVSERRGVQPGPHVRGELVGHPRQRADPRAHVAGALGVVRLGDEQVAREALGALAVGGVEVVDARREAARVAADVVERQQPRVAVERGVLDALGHHRRRRLLEAGDERVPAGRLERQHARQRGREAGLGDRLAVGVLDAARPRLDVGAVDRERRQRALEPGRPAAARRAAAARPRARTSSAPARAWPRRRSSPKRRSSPEISTHRSVSGASPAGSTNSAQASLRNS